MCTFFGLQLLRSNQFRFGFIQMVAMQSNKKGLSQQTVGIFSRFLISETLKKASLSTKKDFAQVRQKKSNFQGLFDLSHNNLFLGHVRTMSIS